MSNLLGLPAAVLTGIATGGSAAFFITFELDPESKLAQMMMKTKLRTVIVSSMFSLTIGAFCGPVAGVISEMITYPAMAFKSWQIKKALKKLDLQLKTGESGYLCYKGEYSRVTKKIQPSLVGV